MAWGVQDAWAHSWESQLSWNFAEYSVRGVVWCFGKRRGAVRARGTKNAERSCQAGGQRWVTWNSFISAAMVFTDSCKPNCWGSVLVNLEFSLRGWSYELEQGRSPQGGCILFWGHPTGWVNTGVVASCSCSVLPVCVCLWLPIPPWEKAGAAGPSWFCTDHLQAQRDASGWFCCIYWREMMSQRGVPVVQRSALGNLEEALKPTRHFWFCMEEHKQAK